MIYNGLKWFESGRLCKISSKQIKDILNVFSSSIFSKTNLSGFIYNIFKIPDLIAEYISFFWDGVVNDVIAAAFKQGDKEVIFCVILGIIFQNLFN